jgi:chromosome segregation ATPase
MSTVWDKLFGNNPAPANDSRALAIRYEPGEEPPSAKPPSVIGSLGALASGGESRASEATPKSLKVARTFDSIGRRNEALRTHLDSIEFSFRNIEAIRSQFYDVLAPIDQTLIEIERTKVAHLEAERKFEALTAGHERLRGDHAALTLERNALAVRHEELSERVNDLEKAIAASEAAASEARAALTDRRAKLERTERELEDNKRRLHTVSEQLPALRAEFADKEKRLQEVEQQRAAVQDQNVLMAQETRSLRMRIDEFVANGSKLNRHLSDLESRRDDLTRRIEELEATLTQETAAHAKLKNAHLDAAESHRLIASNLREELSAMSSRSEAAERLLAEARENLRQRDAEIRGFEQRALESSLAAKSRDVALADLEKDLASTRALHAEVDSVRATLDQRSTELAKALEVKDATLQRAEQKIVMVEGRIAEQSKAMDAERASFEDSVAKLKEELEAERSARAFAEGALQAARQERGSRRHDAEGTSAAASKDPQPPAGEIARDKIARLRG